MIKETISDKLNSFYQDYNLGDEGGNQLSYVIIEITSFFKVYIPNWDNRRKAVLRHDIHHLLTGYKSEILGEFEIAAWEIGSGCMNYFAAYLLNSGGLIAGIFLYPRPTFKAFILGCRTTNLYQMSLSDDDMKSSTIEELKNKIGLNSKLNLKNIQVKEMGKLFLHFILSFGLNIVILLCSPLIVIYNLWMYGKKLFNY
jgi:hypothetical protein